MPAAVSSPAIVVVITRDKKTCSLLAMLLLLFPCSVSSAGKHHCHKYDVLLHMKE